MQASSLPLLLFQFCEVLLLAADCKALVSSLNPILLQHPCLALGQDNSSSDPVPRPSPLRHLSTLKRPRSGVGLI